MKKYYSTVFFLVSFWVNFFVSVNCHFLQLKALSIENPQILSITFLLLVVCEVSEGSSEFFSFIVVLFLLLLL